MIIDVMAVETGGTVVDIETITGLSVSLGKSPYINEATQTWWVYNDATNKYFDTGIPSTKGPKLSLIHI